MRNLSDPDTDLDRFFVELGGSAAQVAPVAEIQARLFSKMADTFAALVEDPEALQQTIERSPPTLAASIDSFRATAAVPRRLRRPGGPAAAVRTGASERAAAAERRAGSGHAGAPAHG